MHFILWILHLLHRLVKKLPKVVLGTDELHAIAHSQKLLVLIYFSGPQLVADYLLQSPVSATGLLFFLFLSFKVRIFCHDAELSILCLGSLSFSLWVLFCLEGWGLSGCMT